VTNEQGAAAGAEREVPAGDASEQRLPVTPEPGTEPLTDDIEVPVADALDQARTVRATADVDIPTIADDVPEADALDQARTVVFDDDDRHE
jgi:hypothetical protein